MANPVVQTATCTCSFGAAPAVLTVTSQQTVSICKMPAATIQDGAALSNVPTFGMCSNPANPTVASATALGMGGLTPPPRLPPPGARGPGWPPGAVCKRPLLNSTSKLTCSYGGVIQVTVTPAMTVKVP